jgi:hypothetical protein
MAANTDSPGYVVVHKSAKAIVGTFKTFIEALEFGFLNYDFDFIVRKCKTDNPEDESSVSKK